MRTRCMFSARTSCMKTDGSCRLVCIMGCVFSIGSPSVNQTFNLPFFAILHGHSREEQATIGFPKPLLYRVPLLVCCKDVSALESSGELVASFLPRTWLSMFLNAAVGVATLECISAL